MGQGRESEGYTENGLHLPGKILNVTDAKAGEHNQRSFYTRWAQFIQAKDWHQLATWRNGKNGHA